MIAMSGQSIETWLQQPWPPTVIGVGGCDANDRPFFHLLAGDRTLHVSDDCWRVLNEAIAQLDAHGFNETEALWVFETAVMWIARRPDSAWVGIFTPPGLPPSITDIIKTRLRDFVQSGPVTSL